MVPLNRAKEPTGSNGGIMKYDLVGINGNAFYIMAYVMNAMRECRFSNADREAYRKDAMSSGYDHLVSVSYDMIVKCNEIYASL